MAERIGICFGLPEKVSADLQVFIEECARTLRLSMWPDLRTFRAGGLNNYTELVRERVSLVVLHRDLNADPVATGELPRLVEEVVKLFPEAQIIFATHVPFRVQREIEREFPELPPQAIFGTLPYVSAYSPEYLHCLARTFEIEDRV
jgi:hypothetical protein